MKKRTDKYVAYYFHKTHDILKKINPNNIITLQFFQRKNNAMLGGINETLQFLEQNTDTSTYKIKYLNDGSIIQNKEVVLELTGRYQDFGKYEGIIDGILSRSSSIATNAYECKQAAKNKEVIFMGDRADHYLMQEIDGRAVALAGINSVSTEAQNVSKSQTTFGSVPHILIQNFEGNTTEAMKAYIKVFPKNKVIALVDYHNDILKDAKEVYAALKDKLYGVRIDTPRNMKDKMFNNKKDSPDHLGVNVEQVKRLRKTLNLIGAENVKIFVSSGFDANKIKYFEDNNAPVDAYGVGQGMFIRCCNFSADAVLINNKKEAKAGREYRENPKLIEYNK